MSAAAASKIAAMREAKQRREQTSQESMEFCQNVIRTLCQSLRAAAVAQEADAGHADREDAGDLAIKLQSPARVVAVYRLDWPEDLKGKIGAAPSLRVRYACVEQRARPAKVLGFYRRQAPIARSTPTAPSDGSRALTWTSSKLWHGLSTYS